MKDNWDNEMDDIILDIQGKKVMYLNNAVAENIVPDPESADAWIINHPEEWHVRRFLRKLIRSKDIRIYLKPVFLKNEFQTVYTSKSYHLEHLSDGFVDKSELFMKTPYIDGINRYIKEHRGRDILKYRTEKEFLLQKWFDYYYSRQKNLEPVLSARSLTGYSYPRIAAEFHTRDDAYFVSRKLIKVAYHNGWVVRNYRDTCHLCIACRSGFLNYREACPRCNGHDLKVRPIIHHFRCAYVGASSHFEQGDRLICPKCSSTLKNLGVDYDRPGDIYICNDHECGYEFQEAPVSVSCVYCEKKQDPTDLVVRKIYQYELTKRGVEKGLES